MEQNTAAPGAILNLVSDVKEGSLLSVQDQEAIRILEESDLDLFAEHKPPPVCIEIMCKDGRRAIFGSLGNIGVIKGKAKVSKSMLVSVIAAAALRNGNIEDTVFCSFPADKRGVVWFDTEMAEHDVYKAIRRATTIAGGDYADAVKNLKVKCLSKYSYQQRVNAIDYYIRTNPHVGFVIIDGVRDLIGDINDSEASFQVLQYLKRWTYDYNIFILTVIHQNKGKENSDARGHLGTELTNKAETSVNVNLDTTEKNKRVICPAQCRNREFDDFAFLIDEHGIPRIDPEYNPSIAASAGSKTSRSVSSIDKSVHLQALKMAFKVHKEQSKGDLGTSIRAAFDKMGIKVSFGASWEYLSHYEHEGYVTFVTGAKNRHIYRLASDPPF